MSEVVRLTLVSHALTDAMSAGRFPTDEPVNSVGHRQVDAFSQRTNIRVRIRFDYAAAHIEDRTLGRVDHSSSKIEMLSRMELADRRVLTQCFARGLRIRELKLNILGHIDQHRARPPALG